MKLRISKEISLPIDVVTQTIAILAKRRAGKSYTMRKLVEQLLQANQQVVLVDPKGDQWGIRSSADGKRPGFPIVILGGEHGDAPLEVNAGEVVAKLVVEERVSVLLDLSTFRKHEIATFMAIFLENIYRLKAQEKYRTPMMLVIDEADAIAPQKPQRGEERMLGAAEDIVRRGGQRGIGCALITQRSAVLNKNVLTQAQMLIVLRTIAPQDLAAMNAWVDVHGTPEERKILMESLPSLPIGDAWFWSPGWPTAEGIFGRSHVLPIETFDSGATPKPGERVVVPKNLADVDLDVLKKQMAATIEKARNDNPVMLRKKIGELERELKDRPGTIEVKKEVEIKKVEVPVLKDSQIKRLEQIFERMVKEAERHGSAMSLLWGNFNQIGQAMIEALEVIKNASMVSLPGNVARKSKPAEDKRQHTPLPVERTGFDSQSAHNGEITAPEQKVINAVAWCEKLNIEAVNVLVAFLAGYSPYTSSFQQARGSLGVKGLVQYIGGTFSLTANGQAQAEEIDLPTTRNGLHEAVLRKLRPNERKVLQVLIEAYPEGVANVDLATQAGYSEKTSSYQQARGSLGSFGLIKYENGMAKAEDILFKV